MIEERFPAPADRGLECLKALNAGITLTATHGTVEGRCGCGHPIVAKTWEGAHNSMRDHLTRRIEQ